MTSILMQREGTALRAVGPDDLEKLFGIPEGRPVEVEAPKLMRSWQHHKFFFGLLRIVFEALPDEMQEEYRPYNRRFRYWVECRVGHCTRAHVPNSHISAALVDVLRKAEPDVFFEVGIEGCTIIKAKSIAWHKLDHRPFYELVKSVIEFAATELLPGTDRRDIVHQVEAMTKVRLADLAPARKAA